MPQGRDVGERRPAVIAHRGASAIRPEHTLGAFRQAIRDGADAIECDVRMTLDGHLVCLHDRSVDRTSDGHGLVSRHTLRQLQALDWSGPRGESRHTATADDRRVVTLAELAELVRTAGRPLGLVVETKHPSRWGPHVDAEVVRVLGEAGLGGPSEGRVPSAVVLSFWPVSLRRIGLNQPQLARGQLFAAAAPGTARGSLAPGVSIAALDIALVRRRPHLVARHQARGHRVYAWTVNDPADLRHCQDLGVDAVIVDDPGAALAVLDGRR